MYNHSCRLLSRDSLGLCCIITVIRGKDVTESASALTSYRLSGKTDAALTEHTEVHGDSRRRYHNLFRELYRGHHIKGEGGPVKV